MMGVKPQDSDYPVFVEVDPTGRYGRYSEVLGKGASKTVYRAFDEYEGIEVAWNQVKLNDFLQSPEDIERLYCEIHLLKTLKHKNIMKFYTSWVDISKRNINFVTELFSSGTIRQYRQKYRRVHIRAVKNWCRQILRGLLYLHSHDPPIIHRDLKCDNIFINGNQGVVKIGDLGLAAILRNSYAAHCVGTPEFMAPEVYEEEYNELVDIYSFGMCVLEMVTFEYPYSECTHPAEIYKKVISGIKPEALYRVQDPEVRQFIEKCLATASRRLPARELINDPFLRIDDQGSDSWEGDISEMCQIIRPPSYDLCSNGSLIANGFADNHLNEIKTQNGWNHSAPEMSHILRQPSHNLLHSNGSLITNGFADDLPHEITAENGWDCNAPDFETRGVNLFSSEEDEPFDNVDITIKGTRREDGAIFLRLRIADEEGRVQNIYFLFDIETDTALNVATEMVGELDITDYDVSRIAEMIDGEVSSLVPEWKPCPSTEVPGFPTTAFCNNCASNVSLSGSLLDYLSIYTPGCTNQQSTQCSGQFEEITYQVEGSEQCLTEGAPVLSTSQSDILGLSSQASRESHSDEEDDQLDRSANNEKEIYADSEKQTTTRECIGQLYSNSIQYQSPEAPGSGFQCPPNISNDYENKVHQELRWLKSKHQMEQKGDINQQLVEEALNRPTDVDNRKSRVENGVAGSSGRTSIQASSEKFRKSFNSGKRFSFNIPPRRNLLHTNKSFADNKTEYCHSSRPYLATQRAQHYEANPESNEENMFTAKIFYAGFHLPSVLPRTKSLPQNAVGRNM